MAILHYLTYQGSGPAPTIHRTRLAKLVSILQEIRLPTEGTLSDFGCSDGFILSVLRETVLGKGWRVRGYDFMEDYQEDFVDRRIQESAFFLFDLNVAREIPGGAVDLVTCFETIEHTGRPLTAIDNLLEAVRPGGLVVISVPVEIGIPGVVKFLGRLLMRRNAYGRFFQGKPGPLFYLVALLFGENTGRWRDPAILGWGPHLGFDYRKIERHLRGEVAEKGRGRLIRSISLAFGFHKAYVIRKIDD